MKFGAMRIKTKKMKDQKGFSLIELMIVIAILSVLGTAIYMFFTNISNKSTIERSVSTTQQKARLTVEVIARDIRMLGLDPTGQADAGLVLAGVNSLIFSADLNYDGAINDPYERISYSIVNGNLIMSTAVLAAGADPNDTNAAVEQLDLIMLSNLNTTDLRFRYFNRNDVEIAAANAVWNVNDTQNGIFTIEISLSARTPTMEGEVERTYSTRVRLRNAIGGRS